MTSWVSSDVYVLMELVLAPWRVGPNSYSFEYLCSALLGMVFN